MKATIIGLTIDIEELRQYGVCKDNQEALDEALRELKVFSGKNAGICYGENGYFGTAVTDPEKAYSRFKRVIPTCHHSIADHAFITVLFEGLPKVIAMTLNNLGFYNTSEKSGRYTVMTGCSEVENKKYEKWIGLFETLISKLEPDMNEGAVKKKAMENARYMLDVFTPTTMSYTTSLRQWNYIYDWCKKFEAESEKLGGLEEKAGYTFHMGLSNGLRDIAEQLKEIGVYTELIRDNKNRSMSLWAIQTGSEWGDVTKEYFHECYQVKYKASFVHLAQAQRHRTLHYEVQFDGIPELFYIPNILKGTEYENEWLDDLEEVASNGIVPQATLVDVVETGRVTDFVLKCEERVCSRAQLEIMEQTIETVKRMYKNIDASRMTTKLVKEVLAHEENGEIVVTPKCHLCGCKEVCKYGGKNLESRVI